MRSRFQGPVPALRDPGTAFERATNAQQKRLVEAYDRWARGLQGQIAGATLYHASQHEIEMLIEQSIPALRASLLDIMRSGTVGAAELSARTAKLPARVLSAVQRQLTLNDNLVTNALVPNIEKKLLAQLGTGGILNKAALEEIFVSMRAWPAQYAGGYWVMIFETQREMGLEHESLLRRNGEEPEPVRWILDQAAAHCEASPGYYGCVDLAGDYHSWADLPTVPAGQVTCRGNCRCRLEAYHNGEWRGGLTAADLRA